MPTDRASDVAAPIADILERIRGVVANAEGFDAQRSRRRFTIGAPDAVFAVVLPPLLKALAARGPFIDLSVRELLPQHALGDLDGRRADLVIQPLAEIPARFQTSALYDEEFAIAVRSGHPLQSKLTLDRYCAAKHVLVSTTGDPHGNVDVTLKRLGRVRRVAATVPNFLFALAVVAETDFMAAVPRHGHCGSRWSINAKDPNGASPTATRIRWPNAISLTESAALARGDRSKGP